MERCTLFRYKKLKLILLYYLVCRFLLSKLLFKIGIIRIVSKLLLRDIGRNYFLFSITVSRLLRPAPGRGLRQVAKQDAL